MSEKPNLDRPWCWNGSKLKLQCTVHETDSHYVLLVKVLVWVFGKRSQYENSSTISHKIHKLHFFNRHCWSLCGCGQLILLESVLSQCWVLSNVDLNKCIPAARLFSVLPAMETQQHQLYTSFGHYKYCSAGTCCQFNSRRVKQRTVTDLVQHSSLMSFVVRWKYCLKAATCTVLLRGPPFYFVSTDWWQWEAVCLCDCGGLKGR